MIVLLFSLFILFYSGFGAILLNFLLIGLIEILAFMFSGFIGFILLGLCIRMLFKKGDGDV